MNSNTKENKYLLTNKGEDLYIERLDFGINTWKNQV